MWYYDIDLLELFPVCGLLKLLQVPAAHLSSDSETGQSQSVYSGLYQRTPAYKMLYVTPEKVIVSLFLLAVIFKDLLIF